MSFRAKRELLAQVAWRYQQAPPDQKSLILNEFVAATSYNRKYAIRLLASPPLPLFARCYITESVTPVLGSHNPPAWSENLRARGHRLAHTSKLLAHTVDTPKRRVASLLPAPCNEYRPLTPRLRFSH